MPDEANGTGEAHDASVDGTEVDTADLVAEARAAVQAAETKVQRQTEHLEGAHHALEQALAELAALEG